MILAPFISQMDSTIANVSLSFTKRELHSSIASAQRVVSGYLLALTLMLPLNAWLVARLGAGDQVSFTHGSLRLYTVLFGR